jgi:tRNA-Thr(GGU) m(6)t(6)A37 methyltransferase TsaA
VKQCYARNLCPLSYGEETEREEQSGIAMVDDYLETYLLRPIGIVRSSLKRREDCPHQGGEGAPEAWLEIDPTFVEGLDGIIPGRQLILLSWLHKAQRNVLKLHPRGDPQNPLRGVFTTRSADRPNPIGLHRVEVLEVEKPGRIKVRPLELLEGTPIIDIKPVLPQSIGI